jgi:hypothetical protein
MTVNIPTNTPTILPFNSTVSSQGTKISLNTSGANINKITLTEIGMYSFFCCWALHDMSIAPRMSITYILRSAAGNSVGPTTYTQYGGSPTLSQTIYVSSVPTTIEFLATHYNGSDVRLGTNASTGVYSTYASVLFLY